MTDETVKSWTLKVEFGGEVRRFKGWPTDDSEPTFESLLGSCLKLFDLPAVSGTLQYRDDEGDLCKLSAATLSDALFLAKDSNVLRLTLCTEEVGVEQTEQTPFEHAGLRGEPEANESRSPSRAASRVAQGFQHFKEQVQNDFDSSNQDMRQAFGASEPGKGVQLAGVAAGLMAACRLMPVRATRLAAHSLEAVATNPETVNSQQTSGAEAQTARSEVRPEDNANEIDHFKQQVAGDFETAREEVKAALGYVLPGAASDTQRQSHLQEAIPDWVGSLCGISVAASLLPLRAARLAVAKAAAGPTQLGETPVTSGNGTH